MMIMKCPLKYFQYETLPSLGLFFLRAVIGVAFVFHGLPKVQNAFGWMGDAMPGLVQAFAAYGETVGGGLLALGLLTPLANLWLIAVMLGALNYHIPAGDPFVGQGGPSYELALVYLTANILFLLNSPGKFSLDYLICAKRNLPG